MGGGAGEGPPSAEPLAESKGSPLHAFSATSLGEGERTKDGVLSDEADAAKVRVSAKKLSARVRASEDAVAAMNLDGVWNMRPILDGGKVMKLTGAKGPVMKVLTGGSSTGSSRTRRGERRRLRSRRASLKRSSASTCSAPRRVRVWLPRVRTHPYRRPIGGL